MTWRRAIPGLLFLSFGVALGCAHGDWERYRNEPPSPVEAHWGEAYHQVKEEQVANPRAGRSGRGPEGMGAAEADAVADYEAERATADYQERSRGSLLDDLEQ